MDERDQGVAERLTALVNHPLELARLAERGATLHDLGAIFGVPPEALADQHRPLLERAWALHRMRIRRGFLLAADRGDVAALAFLARAHLVEHNTLPAPGGSDTPALVQLPAGNEE